MKKVRFKVSYIGYFEREVDDETANKIMADDEDTYNEIEGEVLDDMDDLISGTNLKAFVEYGVYDEEKDDLVFEDEKENR